MANSTPTDSVAPIRSSRPKYQIFVSSTFTDLREERVAITWEVLKANHIPVGMEAFPATDDRGWKIIQRTIDASDYYVLLIAGRYGSLNPDTGKSWTQTEYEYAKSRGIKVLAFVRDKSSITADQMDDRENAEKLRAFVETIERAHLAKRWKHRDDLRAELASALRHVIEEDEIDGTLPPGWYRGGAPTSPEIATELARLSTENHQLRETIAAGSRKTTFSLEVFGGDGSALGEVAFARSPMMSLSEAARLFEKEEIEYASEGGRQKDASLMEEYNDRVRTLLADEEKRQELQQYIIATALPACTRITLGIRSVHGPTASDVRCRLSFPAGFTLWLGEAKEPRIPYWLPKRPRLSIGVSGGIISDLFDQKALIPSLASSLHYAIAFQGDVSLEGTTVSMRAKKLQHGQLYRFDEPSEVLSIIPPPEDMTDFPLAFSIWSDETPEQKGTIVANLSNT